MNPIRRLVPVRQLATCTGCGTLIAERRRRPCPMCGDTRRTVARGWAEGTASHDEMR